MLGFRLRLKAKICVQDSSQILRLNLKSIL
jgi:hypothetical protein